MQYIPRPDQYTNLAFEAERKAIKQYQDQWQHVRPSDRDADRVRNTQKQAETYTSTSDEDKTRHKDSYRDAPNSEEQRQREAYQQHQDLWKHAGPSVRDAERDGNIPKQTEPYTTSNDDKDIHKDSHRDATNIEEQLQAQENDTQTELTPDLSKMLPPSSGEHQEKMEKAGTQMGSTTELAKMPPPSSSEHQVQMQQTDAHMGPNPPAPPPHVDLTPSRPLKLMIKR